MHRGGGAVTFEEILDHAVAMLQRRGRVTYRTLKAHFQLDDELLETLKDELLFSHPVVDQEGRGLVWTGETASAQAPPSAPSMSAPTSPPPPAPARAPYAYTPAHLAEKILTSRSALEGERKHVTVLFADIKDSTELIRDLDPEDAQKLLDPAIHIMMEAVHRFEGTVNQVLGDGIMSIFGAPIAHEDHAARACYAALAMQAAMQPYAEEVRRSHGITMRIRVGVNSGEVVVRTIGNDLHMDYSAVGQTTNLASRMEHLATPGSVVLTAATLRLVEGLVQVNDLGPVPVKGMSEPVEVYDLTGASSIRRRLQATVARGLTTFVGRAIEIEALTQALEQAGAGHGQLVAAVGEAGVGKSRLVYEFVHSHRTQGWLVLESASVSYGKATPYFPVVDLLKHYVHVEDGDNARTIRAKVTGQILTLDESLQGTIPALLSLLDALPENSPFLQLDPPQRRQRTLDGLKRMLLRESQVQPLLLVFEDLHWIDSETQALLDSLVDSLPTAQLLLLVNYRPEYQHGWGGKTFYTQLRLDPFPPESADAFLEVLLGNDPSLEPLKQLLVERTEGNPFFLEESVRTLVETQVLVGESGVYHLVQEPPTIQVPATVQAILAARIDRLPQDDKRLLQTAAVIGTEVPLSLLQSVVEMSEEALYPCLTHLQAAEFLYETSLFPERVFTFKHALTHEVAYSSLLQERRRVLHTRIIAVLETLAGDRWAERVEQLAHHALRGEVWEKALLYYRQAGQKAMGRSAYREARSCLEQALEALQHVPKEPATLEQAIDLRFDLRNALFPLGEHRQILDHLRTAETLAEALDDQRRRARVDSYMSYYYWFTGEPMNAIQSGKRALTRSLGDFPLQVTTNTHLGMAYHSLGDYRRAVEFFGWIVAGLGGELTWKRFYSSGLPAVLSRSYIAGCLAQLGAFVEGASRGEEGVRIAEAAKHPFSVTIACWGVGDLYLSRGDIPKALALLERGLGLCQDAQLPHMFPRVASLLGSAYALCGRIAEALFLLEQAVEQDAAMHMMAFHPLFLARLSQVYLLAGRTEDALWHAGRALELSRANTQRGYEAWTIYLLGDIAMHHNPLEVDQAETHYHQALDLVNELGMRPLQAHCHRGLGTLYSQTGQTEQAHAELSTAIAMYRDMAMTFWLPETEAALAEVEGR
jgi:class 3 adenylate cyclase/tetratricopeptide (TPR) repeat protein